MLVEYDRVFGRDFVDELALRTWPLWDPTVGIIIYIDGEPIFISSCISDVFGAEDRCDVRNVPPLAGTDWTYYGINERTLPTVAHLNNVSVVFLGDRVTADYPHVPFQTHEVEALLRGGRDMLLTARQAMNGSTYQACYIRHDGYVLPMAPKLPHLLGHDSKDTSWMPTEWFEPQPLAPARTGTSIVQRGDGTTVTLEWTLVTAPNFNMYWVRQAYPDTQGGDTSNRLDRVL